jgi:Tol biopolymer transport system component
VGGVSGGRTLLLVAAGLVGVLVAAGQLARAGSAKTQDRDPAFSVDGKELAFVRWTGATGRVMLMRADGTGLHAVTKPQPQPYGLTWSPDERALAYSSGGDIWRADLDTGALTNLTATTDAQESEAAWSPDGSRLAFVSLEGCFRCTKVYVVMPDGTGRTPISDPGRRPAWSPDGSRIALAGSPIRIVDLDAGSSVTYVNGSFPAWSPNGRLVAYDGRSGLRVLDTAGKGDRLVSTKLGAAPAWSPDGRRIAATTADGSLGIVYANGRGLRVVGKADLKDDAPSWSRDTGLIAFVERGRCGIDVVRADGTHRRRLTRAC